MTSRHRVPLPEGLVPFDSDEGRRLLPEALLAGTASAFYPLSAQFHTQADPAWCAYGSLVTTLNALEADPGRVWKGVWRWFAEELLQCCKSLDEAAKGLTLAEVACVARCNGAAARLERADPGRLDVFRDDLRASVRSAQGPFVVANYDRGALGQTGSGHYSPLAAWHEGTDRALVLDVARFKYPPHWVPVERLFAAMSTTDPDASALRGWLVLDRALPDAPDRQALDALCSRIRDGGGPELELPPGLGS